MNISVKEIASLELLLAEYLDLATDAGLSVSTSSLGILIQHDHFTAVRLSHNLSGVLDLGYVLGQV